MQQQFISMCIVKSGAFCHVIFFGRIFEIMAGLVLNEGGILMAIDLDRLNRPCVGKSSEDKIRQGGCIIAKLRDVAR